MEEREEWSCEEAKCRAKSEVSRSGECRAKRRCDDRCEGRSARSRVLCRVDGWMGRGGGGARVGASLRWRGAAVVL